MAPIPHCPLSFTHIVQHIKQPTCTHPENTNAQIDNKSSADVEAVNEASQVQDGSFRDACLSVARHC